MKECPKCKAEIDELIQFSPACRRYRCRALESYCKTSTGKCQSYLSSEVMETIDAAGAERWECPVCHATIFFTRVGALNFLGVDN